METTSPIPVVQFPHAEPPFGAAMEVLEPPHVSVRDLVVFENDGLIDPIAITTFGVNAKETDNPIGFFGTGLKYAIAVLLREGQKITIYRGTERFDFTVDKRTIRGKEFAVIAMNGSTLGFTTELGKTWETWQAFRELWCNCADERGSAFEASHFMPQEGHTAVVVEGALFTSVYDRRSEYILESNPLYSLNGVDVHAAPSHTIFYRGIAVARMPDRMEPLHTYNITGRMELTEDRTVKYGWQPAERVAEAIQRSEDADLIGEYLLAKNTTFEGSLDFIFHGVTPTPVFIETVQRLSRSNGPKINESAKAHVQKYAKADAPTPLLLDDIQREQLDTAMAFCQDIGYSVDSFPINFVQTLGSGVFGQAIGGEIILTRNAFDAGTKQVAITLIEEFVHLHHGVHDESRAMQERLLHELVSLGERHLGRAL